MPHRLMEINDMQTAHSRRADVLRDAVASYVDAIAVPAFDERAMAAPRGTAEIARAPRRRPLRTAALATGAALAVFVAVDASAVVAGIQRVFAAWTLAGGRTVPMSVREVDLAKARTDVPFEIIVPPSLPGVRMTLREVLSSGSPASDSVAFDLHVPQPAPEVTIVESRNGAGPREFYLSAREPGRGDAKVAPMPPVPKRSNHAVPGLTLVGTFGKRSFVPLTWVTRGTRIVLMSPPGALSDTQVRAIRTAMSR